MLRLLRAMATRLMGRGSSASLTRLQTAVNNHLERGENHTGMMAFPASVSQRPKPSGTQWVNLRRLAPRLTACAIEAAGVAMVTCPAYLVTGRPGMQMPLTRLNDSAFDAQLEGVYFGMWNGSSTVRCFVTRAALTDKAQGSGQAESLDVFHEYRSEIENLASTKYDAGKITSDGLVVVDSPDLNPEQFQQGLA